ncbi:outer membrane autotransporter barrel domain-containing protein [Nitratireductor indicus C115]|uniref:Outer membrane autotransporter barrel domain-containing protein n=1 Tax=Nitratireductor indicus C115 TaxID=1231190 RepID=K2NQ40_9HYPH|nr:autotransporter domain-containing protein [Nitratireductor indicus]EKF39979.1 outer membrane autotransporter barrel domain-containing protein [Nitratireductor indicus C115]SFQ81666.1 outer membrane autotransporter barrel domain-containing protein [Nitratireductor indicus]
MGDLYKAPFRGSAVFASAFEKAVTGSPSPLIVKCIRATLLVGVSAFGLSLAAEPATAQTIWQGGTGDWSDAGNWSAGVPDGATVAEIKNAGTTGTPAVLDSGTGAADELQIDLGNSAIVSGVGTRLDVTDLISIGRTASASESSLLIQSGAKVTAQRVFVGDGFSPGLLTVTGTGSSLSATPGLDFSDRFVVGGFSAGRLIIADGGAVNVGGSQVLDLGYQIAGPAGQLAIGAGGDAGTLSAVEVRMNNVASNVLFDVATDSGFNTKITGSGYLRKTGAGTVTLTGMNTYTGATFIDEGTLALSGQGRINASSGVKVTGTFDVSAASAPKVNALTGTGSVVLGGKYLDINNASGTFSGVIEGSGGVYINGGTQVLTGTNTYLGGTGIGEGAALSIGDGGTSGSVENNILNNGALTFNRSDAYTFAGTMTGNGTFLLTGGGTLTLTGSGSSSGTITIDAGNTLRLGIGGTSGWIGGSGLSGNGITNNGTLVYNRSTNVTYIGPIRGSGDLVKEGSGSLRLSGWHTYTGTTDITAGKLIVDGTFAGPGLTTVRSGAALAGTGTLGSTRVETGAVHGPGNSIGTQTIAGDYTNYGTLAIEVTPAAADQVIVQGAVDITGATLALTGTPLSSSDWPVLNGPYIIIDNQGAAAVNGTFDHVTNNLLFLDETLDYAGGDGNDITLQLTRNDVSFADVAQTPNQTAVSSAIETLGTGNPVWLAIAGLTDEDQARAAFDLLSGEVHASFQGALSRNGVFLRNAANDRIRSAFAVSGASVQPLAFGPEEGSTGSGSDNAGLSFWTEAYGAWADIDSDGNAAAMDQSSGGVFFGADALAGAWRVGLLGGYGQSKLDAAQVSSSAESKDYHLGLYAGTELGKLGIRTGLGYSWHSIDTARNINVGALSENLSADYDAATFQAFGEVGYRFDLSAASIEPFANLAYVHHSSDGFTEHGGSAALTVAGQSMDTGFATIGARMEHTFQLASMPVTAKAMLGWQHAFGDVEPTSVHAFAGGPNFTIAGVPIARNTALIEAGFDFDLTQQATLGLSYKGQISETTSQHGFNGMLSIRF